MLTVNALAAANRIIIPVQAEYLPAKGLEQLLSTVSKVKRQINPKLQIDGILLTMVDNRTNFANSINKVPTHEIISYVFLADILFHFKCYVNRRENCISKGIFANCAEFQIRRIIANIPFMCNFIFLVFISYKMISVIAFTFRKNTFC